MSPIGTIQKICGKNTEKTIVLLNKHFNCKIFVVLTGNSNSKPIVILYMRLHNFLCIISNLSTVKFKCKLLSCHIFSEDLFKIGPLFCYSKQFSINNAFSHLLSCILFPVFYIYMRKSTDPKVVILPFLARTVWSLTVCISWLLWQ